eukprot:364598-Chlamydomonas_euryale.AAC.6
MVRHEDVSTPERAMVWLRHLARRYGINLRSDRIKITNKYKGTHVRRARCGVGVKGGTVGREGGCGVDRSAGRVWVWSGPFGGSGVGVEWDVRRCGCGVGREAVVGVEWDVRRGGCGVGREAGWVGSGT